jgi:2-polyprenyl-6-methoxyphenol hydroxylase-like FAD-dependent oxidoreductase
MSEIVVIGGSVAGLASAFALAEAGYKVRVLERDPQPLPDSVEGAHENWDRPTVPQGVHSHAFGALGTNLLATRAPGIYAALLAAGTRPIRITDNPPPTILDFKPEDDDDQLNVLCSRRSTFELVLRREVLAHPGVSHEVGATVRGLTFSPRDPRRVAGVLLGDGRELPAELVVDASGRRSQAVSRWLPDAGVPPMSVQSSSADITYYTRYYQQTVERPPGILNRGFGAGGTWDHYTAVLFLGDNGTFSISVGVLPEDTPMKNLRHEAAFTAAVRSTPLLAPWVGSGASRPISPVYAMGGLDNSLRTGAPVIGLFSVGDAACTTNPAYGRGVSLALAMAFTLGDIVSANAEDPAAATREFAAETNRMLAPWHADAVAGDRGRAMLWRATISGTPLGPPPPGVINFGSLVATAATDQVVWRRVVRMMNLLAPPEALYNEETIERVRVAHESGSVFDFPGASRDTLVRAVTEAASAVTTTE